MDINLLMYIIQNQEVFFETTKPHYSTKEKHVQRDNKTLPMKKQVKLSKAASKKLQRINQPTKIHTRTHYVACKKL
jgi:hypothetical protein